MDHIQKMGLLVCLSVLAGQDARDGEVDGRWIAVMAVWGILPQILAGLQSAVGPERLARGAASAAAGIDAAAVLPAETGGAILLSGLLPGILLWVISVVTRGAVGAGDALSLWALGFSSDVVFCLDIVTDSLWMTAGCALWGRKLGLRERIPWIPFLWLAFLTHLIVGRGSG